jgi:lipid-A-disaccharide synthase
MACILISAGEVSGDVVGSQLARRLRAADPTGQLVGIGGHRMASAGVEILCPTNHLGSVGVSEAVHTAPALLRAFGRLRRRVRATPPDAAVLIANDVFNVLLARWLRRRGVMTIAYFPPQVWVWRSLAGWMAASFDLILASFPEEMAVYRAAAAEVSFVGHYLADRLTPVTPDDRVSARKACGLPSDALVVALLPGSRRHEVRRLAPALLDAATLLESRDASLSFVLPIADPTLEPEIRPFIERHRPGARLVVTRDSHAAMRAADVALLASGTASLEAALLGVPMVIAYRVAPLTSAIVDLCIRLGLIREYVTGLPNLILGRRVVPEVLQGRATAEALADRTWSVLSDDAARHAMREALLEAAARVRVPGTMDLVADAVLSAATTRHPGPHTSALELAAAAGLPGERGDHR